MKNPRYRIGFEGPTYDDRDPPNLLRLGGWTGIVDSDIMRWRKTYQRVEIKFELGKAAEWLRSDWPKRKKTLYQKFLTTWFSRVCQEGGSSGYTPSAPTASGDYDYQPLTSDEIQAAVAENSKAGGSVDQIKAFRNRELGK